MTYRNMGGKRYGKLTILCRCPGSESGKFLCKCECGNLIKVVTDRLMTGHTTSCGCISKTRIGMLNKTHGMSNTRLYRIWTAMRRRCNDPKNTNYTTYGQKGIIVCDDWNNSFIEFQKWAISNGYSENLTIDRIDNDLGYDPKNCRWVDQKYQQNNRTNNHIVYWNGEEHTISQWSEILNIGRATISYRLASGWSIEDVFSKPVRKHKNIRGE